MDSKPPLSNEAVRQRVAARCFDAQVERLLDSPKTLNRMRHPKVLALQAVIMADALIEALNKTPMEVEQAYEEIKEKLFKPTTYEPPA